MEKYIVQDEKRLWAAVGFMVALFVVVFTVLVAFQAEWRPAQPAAGFTPLTAEERAQFLARIKQIDAQILNETKKIEVQVKRLKAQHDELFKRIVTLDSKHTLHPHIYARLSPVANLQVLRRYEEGAALEWIQFVEAMTQRAVEEQNITSADALIISARTRALRNQLFVLDAYHELLSARIAQYEEEKSIDEWQLAISNSARVQRILKAQEEYDLQWGYGHSEPEYEPFMHDDGTIEYREVEEPARPPRPELPAAEPDPYARGGGINRHNELLLASTHSLFDTIVNGNREVAARINRITSLDAEAIYLMQLVHLGVKPDA